MKKNSEQYRRALICVLLTAVTVAVYWPIKNHEFINYDDNEYVTDNAAVRGGLSLAGVRWAFTSTVSSHWHPVTWLSHMLDCQLFDLNPAGHHLMNLLLHVINTLLLFLIFNNVTGLIWQSAFIAALFALHPFHVESVAWAAERKDTLSMLFWLLTMAAYFRYAARGKIRSYILSLVFFALGLMSKPMVVTLPAILLLMDFWPLKRIGFDSLIPLKISRESAPLGKIVVEKIPFFLLAGISSIVTVIIMKQGGLVAPVEGITVWSRLANALTAYAAYIVKTFWPSDLAPFYPHPGNSLPLWKPVAAFIFLTAISIAVVRFGVRRRYLLVGWLWYLVSLLPVIGLLQVGGQAMADRYTYVSLIGLFIMVSLGLAELLEKLLRPHAAIPITFAIIIAIMMPLTYHQIKYWRDSETLFEYTLTVTKNNYLAHNNLANALGQQGKYDASIAHGLESVRIKPEYAIGYYNLGMAYFFKGDIQNAVSHWSRALELNPAYREVNFNLALAYMQLKQHDKALAHLKAELALDPNHPRALEMLKALTTSPRTR